MDKVKASGENYRELLEAANAAREAFMELRAEGTEWYVEPGERFALSALISTSKAGIRQMELHAYRPLGSGEKVTKSCHRIDGQTYAPMGRFATYLFADSAAALFTSGSAEFVREFVNTNAGNLDWKHNI